MFGHFAGGAVIEDVGDDQALKRMGHDPARDFNERLISFMSQQAEQKTASIKPVEREERAPGS